MFIVQERYERHHQCVFDADALPAAVTLSSRYIPDRYLPDKAIDVMDEAASRVRIQAYEARRAAVVGRHDIQEWEILVQVLDAKDEAVQVCSLQHRNSETTAISQQQRFQSTENVVHSRLATLRLEVLKVAVKPAGGQ